MGASYPRKISMRGVRKSRKQGKRPVTRTSKRKSTVISGNSWKKGRKKGEMR